MTYLKKEFNQSHGALMTLMLVFTMSTSDYVDSSCRG